MRILHINEVYKNGSTGRIAYELTGLLKLKGHEVLNCYGRNHLENEPDSYDISSKIDNYFHCLGTRITDKHAFYSRKSTRRLIEKIEEFKPNIIHLQNLHGYYLNIEILFEYLKKEDIPVVWTLQDCWSMTGHCYHFDYVNCEKWKFGCSQCPETHNYPKSWIVDNSKENWKKKREIFTGVKNLTVVGSSEWVSKIAKQSFLSEYPVRHIFNGIDINTFYEKPGYFKEKFNLKNKNIVLGVANVWSERKGIQYFEALSDKMGDEFQIVVVGDLRGRKKKTNIIYVQHTNNVEELVEIYSDATVFVNPTLEDTFPTTNMESLACGTPVVTFETGGSPESLTPECGIAVDKDNLEALQEAIYKVCLGNKNMSKKCRERALDFDKNKLYLQYCDLYDEIKVKVGVE